MDLSPLHPPLSNSGSTWTEEQRLVDSSLLQFGTSVDISGDTILAGASLGEEPPPGGELPPPGDHVPAGALVFVFNGTTWNEQQRLVASGGKAGFGMSVALDGDTAIVSAQASDVVYAFERAGTTWTEQRQLLNPSSGGGDFDGFGSAVAVQSNSVLVGAAFEDGSNAPDAGTAFSFGRSGSEWNAGDELERPVGSFGAAPHSYDYFGTAVAMTDDLLVIGSRGLGTSR